MHCVKVATYAKRVANLRVLRGLSLEGGGEGIGGSPEAMPQRSDPDYDPVSQDMASPRTVAPGELPS